MKKNHRLGTEGLGTALADDINMFFNRFDNPTPPSRLPVAYNHSPYSTFNTSIILVWSREEHLDLMGCAPDCWRPDPVSYSTWACIYRRFQILWKTSFLVPVPQKRHPLQWLQACCPHLTHHEDTGETGPCVHQAQDEWSHGSSTTVCKSAQHYHGWCSCLHATEDPCALRVCGCLCQDYGLWLLKYSPASGCLVRRWGRCKWSQR